MSNVDSYGRLIKRVVVQQKNVDSAERSREEQQAEALKMRTAFEREMSLSGLYEQGGKTMERSEEDGGYVDQDTAAMWAGFIIGWKAARHG